MTTTKGLKLAEDLVLPANEAVTQKYGFIGRSGSGKSYAAMRLAELFLGAGAQIIALDWVGIWWSLRLAADGKHPGFPHVYIFGGEHADVDLRPESGALMADLVVDKHLSVVLDVMHFRKAERTRFATAFAEQFFHRKKTARTACHLFIEEAQAYLPQFVRGEEARMVGVFEDIGKVGRNYGIGNSLISQRPQAINKDVLNQLEVLLAFQTNGPQERKAIAGWTAENTSAGAAMMQELPKLHVGHALVWSPQWLRIAQPAAISKRVTYDASSTPTQRAKSVAPTKLAPEELEQLGEQMAATIEKAKADDPRELKKQIAQQNAELAKLRNSATRPNPSTKDVDKPVLSDADRALLQAVHARMLGMASELGAAAGAFLGGVEARAEQIIATAMKDFEKKVIGAHDVRRREFEQLLEKKGFQKILDKLSARPAPTTHTPTKSASPGGRETPRAVSARPAVRASDGAATVGSTVVLKPMARAMLIALAQHPDGLSKKKIRVHTGYADSGPVSSTFAQLLAEAWASSDGSRLQITEAGLRMLGPYDPLPVGDELRASLLDGQKLSVMERALLRVICDEYPRDIAKGEARERAGYADSGPVSSAFAHLIGLDYVVAVGKGRLRAAEELFS